jgi:hypothetical protein
VYTGKVAAGVLIQYLKTKRTRVTIPLRRSLGEWNTAIVSRGGKRKRTRFDPVKTQERPENRKIEQSDRQKPKEGSLHQGKKKDKILNRRKPSPF